MRALTIPLTGLVGCQILSIIEWNVDVLVAVLVALCTYSCNDSREENGENKEEDSSSNYVPVRLLDILVRMEELVPLFLKEKEWVHDGPGEEREDSDDEISDGVVSGPDLCADGVNASLGLQSFCLGH